MIYISYIILILVFLIDLLFYIPLVVHFYFDNNTIYLYLFAIPIMKIDKKSNINKLKDKIDIDKIKETKKEDLNLIKTIRLSSLHISINNDIANKYASILFPLTCLNYFQSKIKYSITTQNKIYLKIKITLVNILYELIKIRRIKSERKSN